MSISTTRLSTFLPSRKIEPGSVKASFRVAIVAKRGAGVHDERVPADAGEDPDAVPRASLFVVDAEGDAFPGGCHTGAVLLLEVAALVVAGCIRASKTQSRTTSSSTRDEPPV